MPLGDKWIVGFDLREHSDGAVRFASWMAGEAEGQQKPQTLIGVHVLERDKLRHVQKVEALQEIEKRAHARMDAVAADAGPEGRFAELNLLVDRAADEALSDTAKADDIAGMVIGRRAKVGADPIVRLGGIARRLLRWLPKPVVVTPPDLSAGDIGKGPIIAATDCQDDSRTACHFAIELGKRTGRDVVLVYVVPLPEEWGGHYLPDTSLDQVKRDLQASGEIGLERWAKEQGFQGHPGMVLQGGVLPRLTHLAQEIDSPLIVTGSRKLGPVARFFVASVGTELAATAKTSVAVVPPESE